MNIPIIDDKLAVRLAYQHWSQDGYGRSVITGERFGGDHDDDLARVSVRFDPTTNLSAVLKVKYGRSWHTSSMLSPTALPANPKNAEEVEALWSNFPLYRSQILAGNPGPALAAGAALLSECVGRGLYKNCSATNQYDHLTTWRSVADIKWNITDDVLLRSITGVRAFTDRSIFDLDAVQAQILEVGFGSPASHGLTPDVPGVVLPYPLRPEEASTQWTQEFNLSGKFLGRVDWLIGAFGSWDTGHEGGQNGALVELQGLTGNPPMGDNDGLRDVTNTWALFTQEDFHFNDVVSLTLGARYTEERLKQRFAAWSYHPATGSYTCQGAMPNGLGVPVPITYSPPMANNNPDSCVDSVYSTGPNGEYSRLKSSGTSYLVSLNFQFTDDLLVYLKTSRGFRGGAFGHAVQEPAKPEIDTDYEVGLKDQLFDRRIRINIAAYQTNYSNKQVQVEACLSGELPPCLTGNPTTLVENAASARIRGVELEWQAVPMLGLSLYGNASYTNAVYDRYPHAIAISNAIIDASGLPLAVAPAWRFDAGARYETQVGPGRLAGQADYNYQGAIPQDALNIDPGAPLALQRKLHEAVGLLNARLDYSLGDRGLIFSVWATNLANKAYAHPALQTAYTGGIANVLTQPPRMFGVSARCIFGQD